MTFMPSDGARAYIPGTPEWIKRKSREGTLDAERLAQWEEQVVHRARLREIAFRIFERRHGRPYRGYDGAHPERSASDQSELADIEAEVALVYVECERVVIKER